MIIQYQQTYSTQHRNVLIALLYTFKISPTRAHLSINLRRIHQCAASHICRNAGFISHFIYSLLACYNSFNIRLHAASIHSCVYIFLISAFECGQLHTTAEQQRVSSTTAVLAAAAAASSKNGDVLRWCWENSVQSLSEFREE